MKFNSRGEVGGRVAGRGRDDYRSLVPTQREVICQEQARTGKRGSQGGILKMHQEGMLQLDFFSHQEIRSSLTPTVAVTLTINIA